jgi:hypothetical protein
MKLPQLPGMQVMHALVGCQKRWINSRKRRFHSTDMTYFRSMPFRPAHHRYRRSSFQSFNRFAVLVMDALNLHTVDAG